MNKRDNNCFFSTLRISMLAVNIHRMTSSSLIVALRQKSFLAFCVALHYCSLAHVIAAYYAVVVQCGYSLAYIVYNL